MKEIGPIAEIDCEITMKETGPIAGMDCKNTMTEMNHTGGIDCQSITKMIMKESIIIHFRTMEIGEIIKIVIKTSIGMKISMIVIDLMIWIILMVGIENIVGTGTTPKNTKGTGHTIEIDYMTEMTYIVETGHILEIDHETTVDVSIRWNLINIREGLEIIIRTSMKTGMVGINMNANSEMDKYECEFRNDRYDIIRDRTKEEYCSLGDKGCDSFYAELEELYSSIGAVDVQDMPYFTVEVDVQVLQDLPTKIIDELELSDIHLIERYILDKEEREAQDMEECIVELPDKQETDRKIVVLPELPVKTSCEQEECIEEDIFIRSLPELPELCKAEVSIHEDDIQLETPKVNRTEINELPRKTELEIPEKNAVEIKELPRKIKVRNTQRTK